MMWVLHITDDKRSSADLIVGPFNTPDSARDFATRMREAAHKFGEHLMQTGDLDLAGSPRMVVRELVDHVPGYEMSLP